MILIREVLSSHLHLSNFPNHLYDCLISPVFLCQAIFVSSMPACDSSVDLTLVLALRLKHKHVDDWPGTGASSSRSSWHIREQSTEQNEQRLMAQVYGGLCSFCVALPECITVELFVVFALNQNAK